VAALAVNTVQVTTGEEGILAVLSLVFITTGAFLAGRRPANPVGWLLLGWGMVMALGSFTGAYVNRGLVRCSAWSRCRWRSPSSSTGSTTSTG